MAKKQKAVRSKGKKIKSGVPSGFQAVDVSGSFADSHDFKTDSVIQGRVVEVRTVNTENGKKRVMTVSTQKGERIVWENFQLKRLFDSPKLVGRTVYIRYLGKVDNGGMMVNSFEAAIR